MEVKLTQSEERVAKRRRVEKQTVRLVGLKTSCKSEKKDVDGSIDLNEKGRKGKIAKQAESTFVCSMGSIGVGVVGVECGETGAGVVGLGCLVKPSKATEANGGELRWRREEETLEKVKQMGGVGEHEVRVGGLLASSVRERKEKRLLNRRIQN